LLRFLNHAALIVFVLAVGPALWIGIRFMPGIQEIAPPTPIELIGVLLAGLTIVLGVLAIVIAGLAIWGYAAIKIEAKEAATSAARAAAVDHIESETVQNRLRQDSRKIIEEELKKLQEGEALAESQPAQGMPLGESLLEPKTVGKPYSKDREG
jgi:hypothetical protein